MAKKSRTPTNPPTRFRAPEVSTQPHVRRVVRLLRAVHELHKRGYQLLRVMPWQHGTGSLRIVIGPRKYFSRKNGAYIPSESGPPDLPQYTSASGANYFEWRDAAKDDARALATKFEERFPEVVEASNGRDWPYVGWYIEMLGWAEAGHVPYVWADYIDPPPEKQIFLPLHDLEDSSRLPIPPPGDA